MMNYRRGSTKVLPSLSQSTRQNPQTSERSTNPKNVKEIEQKLSLHDNQITRNQKTIIALTSEFKLLKEELRREQTLNKDNEKMYQAAAQESSRLLKKNKQLKVVIGSLELALKERSKQLEVEKENWKREQNSDSDARVVEMKKIIDRKTAQSQSLTKMVEELRRETNALKRQANRSQELTSQNELRMIKGQLAKIESESTDKDKLIRQKEREIQRLREDERKYINIAKEHSKCEHQFKDIKRTNEQLLEAKKTLEQRVRELTELCVKYEERIRKLEEDLQKGSQKILIELSETSHKLERERKNNEQKSKIIENLKNEIDKLRGLEYRLIKFVKTKDNLKKSSAKLKQSLVCDLCKKVLTQPVTSIPCGHTYCFQCKKGYEKECKKCIGSSTAVRREAVYRNELMDEVIEIYEVLNELIRMFDS